MNKLLERYDPLSLKNRVVMAPLTRSRANQDHTPTAIMATYYGQRAEAGLIITEGTAPSPNGVGYARIPGIYNFEQIEAWKKITAAVHEKGAKIFMQLMHTGRISHPENMPEGARVLGASAISAANTKMHVDGKGELSLPTPKAMTDRDITLTTEEFITSAQNAIKAGFDGVEIHAANGYLLEQFLNPHSNERTDNYGGNAHNRNRLVVDITRKVSQTIGHNKVGIRLSPNGKMNDVTSFEGQHEQFDLLVKDLNKLNIAYIHLVNHESMGANPLPEDIRRTIRNSFKGTLILSGGYDKEKAERHLNAGFGDLVAFGRSFIANPDLITRWKAQAPLNDLREDLLYTPGPEGYIDYPTLEEVPAS